MRFSAAALAAATVTGTCLLCSNVSGFAPISRAFVSSRTAVPAEQVHAPSCACPACTGVHQPSCTCAACARVGRTLLFADATEVDEDVPPEVEAMDGVADNDEAHNIERPARESLKKKHKHGKELSEFNVGDTVTAKVKTITSYGAFMDIGAQTDGLLHISRLSEEFVKDVNEVLTAGQELDVRIVSIDSGKNQVALTLLTEEQEEKAAEQQSRPKRQERQSGRRDDSAVLAALQDKGWNPDEFVDGTVVSTVAFGAFVRVDASQLNSEAEGEMDGLVHISALSTGRADSVESIVNVGDKVKVRCKGIQGGKVSLSMINKEDERQPRGQAPQVEGAKDWKESLEKMQDSMPAFANKPLVVDMRK